MKKTILVTLLLLGSLSAETIHVFSATATRLAMEDVKKEFLKNRNGDSIEFTIGSSGRSYAQFKNGMQFDLFFSADRYYAEAIYNDKEASNPPITYANGVLTLYSLEKSLLKNDFSSLKNEKVKKIAIANPRVSPYGKASLELIKKNFQDSLESKLVLGENVAQAAHFVDSGAAEIGFVPFALLKNSTTAQGSYILIDAKLHEPLEHCFVITKSGEKKDLAKEFAEFVMSARGQEIIQKYGFGSGI
ncbi:MAG: molybdate ABC transporter substrate-binding protein [Sulfurovum sp.]|nr:molybdate ABC transporter substrate-binding protein [Sulfurovum sp.]MDD3500324.1 molybdate ABC transporter substrate-binding protein [Sulfurovum sp.]